jgi:predicted ester cyclase
MATAERSVLEDNKALVRRYLDEIYRGNYDILDEVVSPEYFANRPPHPDGLTGGARYKTQFAKLHRAFPDLRIAFDALIAEGDLVAFHTTVQGTHLGELHGPGSTPWGAPIPPTGRQVTLTVTGFRRVRDGKLVEGFSTWDWLSLLQQLEATVSVGPVVLEPHVAWQQRPRSGG